MAAVIVKGNCGNVISVQKRLIAVGRIYDTKPGTIGRNVSIIGIYGICFCITKVYCNLAYRAVIMPASFNCKGVADYRIISRACNRTCRRLSINCTAKADIAGDAGSNCRKNCK